MWLLKISIPIWIYSKNFGLKYLFIIFKSFVTQLLKHKINLCLITTSLKGYIPVHPTGIYTFWTTHNEWKGVIYIHPWVYIKHLMGSAYLLNSLLRVYSSSPLFTVHTHTNAITNSYLLFVQVLRYWYFYWRVFTHKFYQAFTSHNTTIDLLSMSYATELHYNPHMHAHIHIYATLQ